MGTLLKGGIVVELEPATVERADIRVQDGKITARAPELAIAEGDEVVDLSSKLLVPGLVCCHQRPAATAFRAFLSEPRASFAKCMEDEARMERALDLDAVELLGAVVSLEALAAGATTVFFTHASPACAAGSLTRLAQGINRVGIRGTLSYEVSDRHGAVSREEAIEETVSFRRNASGNFRGMIGAHASFTLSDDALEGLAAAVKQTGAGLHIQMAEDPSDEAISRAKFGESPIVRLLKHDLLNPNALVAHAVHLSWPELSQLISTGAWISHNARANMYKQVGYAPAGKFGSRAVLGCDSMQIDPLMEAQIADLRAREAGLPIDAVRYVANGHHLASQVFGQPIGPLREGAAADLVVLNYQPTVPLNAQNLAKHILSHWSSRCVEAVMIDGVWRMSGGAVRSVDRRSLTAQGREVMAAVIGRIGASRDVAPLSNSD